MNFSYHVFLADFDFGDTQIFPHLNFIRFNLFEGLFYLITQIHLSAYLIKY
jgi:hypothetical protein